MSGYFDSLNRRLREVSVIAVQEPAPAVLPVATRRLQPRQLPAGYTLLRERLLALANGKMLKTLVFAGCTGGEGCTRVVREFGESLAGSGLSVLHIDLAGSAGEGPNPAATDLTEALGMDEPPPAIQLGGGSLAVVQRRAPITDKERFFRAPELAEWLERHRDGYHYVLLDAPPLLRFADATLVGRLSDGVIIVARAEATDRQSLTRARDRLEHAEVNVLGVVLNQVRDTVPPILRPYLAVLGGRADES